jgi:hypothetical protein
MSLPILYIPALYILTAGIDSLEDVAADELEAEEPVYGEFGVDVLFPDLPRLATMTIMTIMMINQNHQFFKIDFLNFSEGEVEMPFVFLLSPDMLISPFLIVLQDAAFWWYFLLFDKTTSFPFALLAKQDPGLFYGFNLFHEYGITYQEFSRYEIQQMISRVPPLYCIILAVLE